MWHTIPTNRFYYDVRKECSATEDIVLDNLPENATVALDIDNEASFLRHQTLADKTRQFRVELIFGASGVKSRVEKATHIEKLRKILLLYSSVIGLSVTVQSNEELTIIANAVPSLERLLLENTSKQSISLRPIHSLRNLSELQTVSDFYDYSALQQLSALCVSCSCIRALDMRTLRLNNLSILESKIDDISSLPFNAISRIKLSGLKKLENIEPLSEVFDLRVLELMYLPNLVLLPSLGELVNLKEIKLAKLRNLVDLSPLATAPNIEVVVIEDGNNFHLEELKILLKIPTLRRVRIGTGSYKKNITIRTLFKTHNIEAGPLVDITH